MHEGTSHRAVLHYIWRRSATRPTHARTVPNVRLFGLFFFYRQRKHLSFARKRDAMTAGTHIISAFHDDRDEEIPATKVRGKQTSLLN